MKRLFVMAMALAASPAILAVDMQPGKWRVTTEMTVEGLPMAVPPQTFTDEQCLTRDDLRIKPPKEQDMDCRMTESSMEESPLTWKMSCETSEGEHMDVNGRMEYQGDTMTGEMTMDGTPRGQPMTIRNTYEGQRIGDC